MQVATGAGSCNMPPPPSSPRHVSSWLLKRNKRVGTSLSFTCGRTRRYTLDLQLSEVGGVWWGVRSLDGYRHHQECEGLARGVTRTRHVCWEVLEQWGSYNAPEDNLSQREKLCLSVILHSFRVPRCVHLSSLLRKIDGVRLHSTPTSPVFGSSVGYNFSPSIQIVPFLWNT